ncbi:protein of unknown function [Methylocaldum szegediense]|uniref:Uncharacterized protein n=1 Tax=Methylocaldum szegediense TaxID=73780 RepID=A0ABN8WZJ6_9GAMM|nr:protein of unknown function [Methylocaldum szegediense]
MAVQMYGAQIDHLFGGDPRPLVSTGFLSGAERICQAVALGSDAGSYPLWNEGRPDTSNRVAAWLLAQHISCAAAKTTLESLSAYAYCREILPNRANF